MHPPERAQLCAPSPVSLTSALARRRRRASSSSSSARSLSSLRLRSSSAASRRSSSSSAALRRRSSSSRASFLRFSSAALRMRSRASLARLLSSSGCGGGGRGGGGGQAVSCLVEGARRHTAQSRGGWGTARLGRERTGRSGQARGAAWFGVWARTSSSALAETRALFLGGSSETGAGSFLAGGAGSSSRARARSSSDLARRRASSSSRRRASLLLLAAAGGGDRGGNQSHKMCARAVREGRKCMLRSYCRSRRTGSGKRRACWERRPFPRRTLRRVGDCVLAKRPAHGVVDGEIEGSLAVLQRQREIAGRVRRSGQLTRPRWSWRPLGSRTTTQAIEAAILG